MLAGAGLEVEGGESGESWRGGIQPHSAQAHQRNGRATLTLSRGEQRVIR